MRELNVALIGYNFMGKAHSYAIGNAAFFFQHEVKPVKKVIVGRTASLVKKAAEEFGWQESATDWNDASAKERWIRGLDALSAEWFLALSYIPWVLLSRPSWYTARSSLTLKRQRMGSKGRPTFWE